MIKKGAMQEGGSLSLQYRPDIDGLRAIAVIAVVVFHAFPMLLPGGFVGVDVFFVISGYLITRQLCHHGRLETSDFVPFYLARARRIFPALIVVLTAVLIGGWIYMGGQDYRRLQEHAVAGASFISNFLLARELDYFSPSPHATPLLHLWSLAIEEQFYLLWPAVLWLILRSRHSGAWFLAIMFTSLAFSTHLVIEAPAMAFFSSPGRWWELMIGAFLAHQEIQGAAIWKRFSPKLGMAISAAGLFLIVVATLVLTPGSFFPGVTALWPTLGAVMVICGAKNKLLEYKGTVFLGRISYPLYLWHWPLIAFFALTSVDPVADVEMIGVIFLSVLLAAATYWFVETPIRSSQSKVRVSVLVSCGLLTVGVAGAFVDYPNNYRSRLDQDVRAIYDQSQIPTSWRKEECFLKDRVDFATFESCKTTGPSVAIWGDSHAAALYPGLLEQGAKRGIGVALFSVADCAPILTSHKEECNARQSAAIKQIRLLRPQVAIVHARWDYYSQPNLVQNAVETLRQAGIQRVVVVGPVPYWKRPPHFAVAAYLRKAGHLPSQRLLTQRAGPTSALEATISRSASQVGATYLSATEQLCNSAGCLAWLGSDKATMLYWDESHLSEAGSKVLSEAFALEIFGEMTTPLK